MQFVSRTPARPLGDFVERFWQVSDVPAHIQERIVPSGTVEMVFNLRENEFRIYEPGQLARGEKFSGAMVSGTYGSAFAIDARQHALVVGVHFRPGGAYPFLGAPAGELADQHVDLELLWGTGAAELRERLCAARQAEERFRLLAQALTAHLFRPLEHHYAVLQALEVFARNGRNPRVREVAQETGLSQRRFIRVFAREVGLTPKQFCRVRRFQRTLTWLRQNATPDWTQLVFDCGYFDQSHFINDFRRFSGLQPTEYFPKRNSRVMENHVPLAA